MPLPNADPGDYSKAFEGLVENQEDLPGLLAYALYKQSIREAALDGRVVHSSANRRPTPTEISAYRKTG